MRKLILLTLLSFNCYGYETFNDAYVQKLTQAIYKTEGGSKTKYPYGIHWETNYAKAKRIAENTVRNNHRRWKASGSSEDYISFLSKRYCPYNSEVWRKNVNKFLSEKR